MDRRLAIVFVVFVSLAAIGAGVLLLQNVHEAPPDDVDADGDGILDSRWEFPPSRSSRVELFVARACNYLHVPQAWSEPIIPLDQSQHSIYIFSGPPDGPREIQWLTDDGSKPSK